MSLALIRFSINCYVNIKKYIKLLMTNVDNSNIED